MPGHPLGTLWVGAACSAPEPPLGQHRSAPSPGCAGVSQEAGGTGIPCCWDPGGTGSGCEAVRLREKLGSCRKILPHSPPRGSALQGEANSDVPVLSMHFPHSKQSEPGLAFLPNPSNTWISRLITAFPLSAALIRFLMGDVTALLSWEHLWNIKP